MPQSTNRTLRRATAALSLAALALLAVAGLAVTGGQADAAPDLGGVSQPEDLPNCFAFGIDQVGGGNLDAGIERFDDCITDDYSFEFVFFAGGPSIVCPGPDCPIQDHSSPAELRADTHRADIEP